MKARGEAHGCAVLSEGQAREIRALLATDATCKEIARAYGVSLTAVSDIGNKTWKHIAVPHDKRHQKGQGHVAHKLTDSQVLEIRALFPNGPPGRGGRQRHDGELTYIDVAARFGVCPQLVSGIVRRVRWKHLP